MSVGPWVARGDGYVGSGDRSRLSIAFRCRGSAGTRSSYTKENSIACTWVAGVVTCSSGSATSTRNWFETRTTSSISGSCGLGGRIWQSPQDSKLVPGTKLVEGPLSTIRPIWLLEGPCDPKTPSTGFGPPHHSRTFCRLAGDSDGRCTVRSDSCIWSCAVGWNLWAVPRNRLYSDGRSEPLQLAAHLAHCLCLLPSVVRCRFSQGNLGFPCSEAHQSICPETDAADSSRLGSRRIA